MKSCIFTTRLIAYHLTFVPLGGKRYCKEKTTGVIWHHRISGWNAVLNSVKLRDLEDVIFWADNYSAQNKNWVLYTALVYYTCNPSVCLNTITFKYFEPSHTFMAADSFHHQIETEIQSKSFCMILWTLYLWSARREWLIS